MERNFRCDFHSHPLSHKYYPDRDGHNRDIILSEDDKKDIRSYVDWCINERKLDVIAITDHDLIQSSLYAKKYAKKNHLPIKVVTGAECEVFIFDENYDGIVKSIWKSYNYCHILVLGVSFIPYHKIYMTELEFESWANEIRDIGGIVVMSHPSLSPLVFYTIAQYLDGFELLNRDYFKFSEGRDYSNMNNLNLKTFMNSDYHYYGEFSNPKLPIYLNIETEEFVNKLLY